MYYLKKVVLELSRNLLFQIVLVVIFIIPLIETIGQYISSSFMKNEESFPIIFWPGTKVYIGLSMKVFILMSIMASLYIVGIGYLLMKKELGIVTIIGIVGGIFVSVKLGNVVNYFTGWRELEGMSAPNFINRSLFSLWTNPLWEEIVFRGIPLILLLLLKKKLLPKEYKYATIAYFLIPSVIFAAYHVPNHGLARITDTFVLGLVFAYLALKHSFFAPLVVHYFFDIRWIITITSNKSLPKGQIIWLIQNAKLLNRIYLNSIFYLKIIIPIILIWNVVKTINTKIEKSKSI